MSTVRIVESDDLVSQLLIYRKLFTSCRSSFLSSSRGCVLVKRWTSRTPQLAGPGIPVPGSDLAGVDPRPPVRLTPSSSRLQAVQAPTLSPGRLSPLLLC